MKKVGFIGWRGIVGSVLMQRMREEQDFNRIYPIFFSTLEQNNTSILPDAKSDTLYYSYDINILKELDIIVTCGGSNYTNDIYPKLRRLGWIGYWLDSSSSLRMNDNSIIILDPINKNLIDKALNKGVKTFVGGNCVTNLILMSLGSLFSKNLVDWAMINTYQSISGGGTEYMRKFLMHAGILCNNISEIIHSTSNLIEVENKINFFLKKYRLSNIHNTPLITNVVPWIDKQLSSGQSFEEWKIQAEINKILSTSKIIPIDGTCVRIGSLRCHSQSVILKLKKNISLKDIEHTILSHNWVKVIPNDRETTIRELTPILVSGTLVNLVGRLRKLTIGPHYLSAFIIGDQLLWGAAEPLRRMLRILA